jgi:hypothetical protein
LIASGTDEDKPIIHIWEKYAKRQNEKSRACECNFMTLLVLLNIVLIILFTLVGLSVSGGQNWFNTQSLEIQALRDPTTRDPSVEKNLENAKGGDDVIYL